MGGWRVHARSRSHLRVERGWTSLHTGAIADCECVTQAIATSREPHPNPDLAKVRGPENHHKREKPTLVRRQSLQNV
ncbi:hypothetical protein J0895_16930 [Phormidium pseudopriestleyi FRX01]|uniref:Uncharacterized protein n=1 Tax=Phormidium pseudopriestleyi FRX01 TaxID=1759528 RepID=A0ABS3FUF1_9CYAN|nr:hypothetical protein [Phormidium pseudopriestleyi]MBO0350745.1 hypothetical protein [Phormidium pseudopriestleyi FRX01]